MYDMRGNKNVGDHQGQDAKMMCLSNEFKRDLELNTRSNIVTKHVMSGTSRERTTSVGPQFGVDFRSDSYVRTSESVSAPYLPKEHNVTK